MNDVARLNGLSKWEVKHSKKNLRMTLKAGNGVMGLPKELVK